MQGPHRKLGVMFRDSLKPDSAYVDIALHGDETTSLQFRRTAGAVTEQIHAPLVGAEVIQLERKGKVREEVVGVDDKTKIEKGGANVKLRDLQETDKALINYEPEAYTPAIAIKVTGKGTLKKTGGDD